MAYQITDFGQYEIDSDYPLGTIKDNTGPAGTGTPVTHLTFCDIFEQNQKLLSAVVGGANGLPDNVTNGHQILDAHRTLCNDYVTNWFQNQLGTEYDATIVYVLSGCATRADDGIVFCNGEIFAVQGNSGPACGGGTIDVLALRVDSDVAQRCLYVTCGASGSGYTGANSDFAALVREFINFDWFDVPATGTGKIDPTTTGHFYYDGTTATRGQLRYKRSNINNIKTVVLDGWCVIDGAASGNTIFQMPAEYAPDRITYVWGRYSVGGAAATATVELIIKPSGEVNCNQTTVGATNYLCLSGITIPTA